jgi:hypothetical protein
VSFTWRSSNIGGSFFSPKPLFVADAVYFMPVFLNEFVTVRSAVGSELVMLRGFTSGVLLDCPVSIKGCFINGRFEKS